MRSQHNLNQDNLALFGRSISESNFIHVRIVKRQISTRDLIGSVACIPTTCSCASDVTLNIQHARFSKFCHLQSESVMSQHSIHFHVTFYQILDLMCIKSIKTYITSLFTFLNNNSISFIHCGTLGELDLMNRERPRPILPTISLSHWIPRPPLAFTSILLPSDRLSGLAQLRILFLNHTHRLEC